MSRMSDEDRLVCKYCEKVIRYERPLFCPYCGMKIDPVEGLEPSSDDVEIYKWSRVAPRMMNVLIGWMVLVVPVTLLFGRGAFVVLSCLLLAVLFLMIAGNFFIGDRRD